MPDECKRLFVYGTLRAGSGQALAGLLAARTRLVGQAKTAGRLFDLGPYPGMIEATEPDQWVHGEILELNDAEATLDTLDDYEGSQFFRQLGLVFLSNGEEQTAWMYRYRGSIDAARHIPCGDYFARGGIHGLS